AARRAGQIGSTGRRWGRFSRSRWQKAVTGQEGGGERRRQLSLSRNVSWQALQPFFRRSSHAAGTASLLPLFTATRSASALAWAFFCASRNLFQSVQISGFVAYLPSGLVPPDPGGNNSGILVVDWIRLVAPA